MKKPGERMIELHEKIEQSQGWFINNKIGILGISYHIFINNYNELRTALMLFKNPEVSLQLMDQDHPERLDQFQSEIIRFFHNFLASAKSLVEHTRILVRELYVGSEFENNYNEKVNDEFTSSELTRFIQDLRNYILHKGLPMTSATINFSRDNGVSSTIFLDVDTLRTWDRWTRKAQDYLINLKDQEDLLEIVSAYTDKVISFYSWFGQEQSEIHKTDFEGLHQLQDELRELITLMGITSSL